MHRTLFADPVRPRSPGAALVREGVWPLSHSSPSTLGQSCRSLAAPSIPLGVGGLGSPLSPGAFAALPLRFCHFRKGPSVQASAPEPLTSSAFHLPRQPVPMPDHSFNKEIFPIIQSKPPLMQLEAIASHSITSYLGEETNTCLTTTSFQVAVESNKVPPQRPPD